MSNIGDHEPTEPIGWAEEKPCTYEPDYEADPLWPLTEYHFSGDDAGHLLAAGEMLNAAFLAAQAEEARS